MRFLLIFLSLAGFLGASDKLYIAHEELDCHADAFHIHVGENLWIETNSIHRDVSGLYTFHSSILQDGTKCEYVKTWRCPYCNNYWPIGSPCKNPNCPSKYKA
jgi:hypothetical protein